MKPQTILVLSLVFNLSLGAVAFHFFRPKSAPPIDAPVAPIAGDSSVGERSNFFSERAPSQQLTVTNYNTQDFSWHLVEAQDYKEYIANLRAVECPEETIRDIISADVNKLYAARYRELRGPEAKEYKYWKTESFNSNTKEGYELQRKYRALEKEKSALLVELLGVDPEKERNRELGYLNYTERNFSFLSDDKKDKVRQVQEKFEEQRQEMYRRGILDDDDQKELRKIHVAQMAEMAQFLTPKELEQYELRASQTASQLRHDLDGFEPSENEFREIFQIRKAREEDLVYNHDPDDKDGMERRKKALEEVDAQIKAQLGETRFAEYKRAQDWSYKELARLEDRAGLAKGTAASVYDMKKIVEDQVKKVRENKTLSSDQRNQILQEIRDETERTIVATLGGEKNFNRFKSRGGHWVSTIAPNRPNPTRVTP